jgi:hypothetical protein
MLCTLALCAAGCDYHETFRPTYPRSAQTGGVDVSLASVGYDGVTLAITVDVRNASSGPVEFHPERVALQLGTSVAADPLGNTVTTGLSGDRAAIRAVEAGTHGGLHKGVAVFATTLAGAELDALVLLAINEAARGPRTGAVQHLAAGKTSRYTLQFPVRIVDDHFVLRPSDDSVHIDHASGAYAVTPEKVEEGDLPVASGCHLSFEGAFVGDGLSDAPREMRVLDGDQPHGGLGPPAPPKALFLIRLGGGPGFGPTEGVVGIELAAGPQWGRTALVFSGALGFGFPLGVEGRYRWLDTAVIQATSTLGCAMWFFPGHFAQGARTGVELGLKLRRPLFGWAPSPNFGLYARGGPTIYPHAAGGELDFGIVVGGF